MVAATMAIQQYGHNEWFFAKENCKRQEKQWQPQCLSDENAKKKNKNKERKNEKS